MYIITKFFFLFNSRHKKIPPIYQVFLNPINRRYFTTLLY
nr:MAG TPA: hypothetical protein [Caudoviricetes sp.]DAV65683.1 MAG TPA: hypothetical protein [Caudoviricetes sp.]